MWLQRAACSLVLRRVEVLRRKKRIRRDEIAFDFGLLVLRANPTHITGNGCDGAAAGSGPGALATISDVAVIQLQTSLQLRSLRVIIAEK